LSVDEEELGDDVADMIACSTDENLWWTPSLNVMLLEMKLYSASMNRCSAA